VIALTPQRLVLAVAALGGAATAAIIEVPQLRFAYDAPEARVALETAAASVGLLAAYLMLGRFLSGRRLDSLILATGLASLAVPNLVGAILLAVDDRRPWRTLTAGGSVAGAALIAAAALVPERLVESRRGRLRDGLVAAMFVVAVTTMLTVIDAVASTPTPPLVTQVLAMVFYLVAAVGFAGRAERSGDAFFASVAVAAMLGAFARLHYVLFAPTTPSLVRSGDAFRLLFYCVLFVGAAREIRRYWRSYADNAVLEERRRIARDLHDGVAQELAYIGRRAHRIEDEEGREIVAAAERALNDSRRAIAALTLPFDRTLAETLTDALGDVAGRHGVELDLRLAHDVDVGVQAREALARIACEAVANAARHGGAGVVRVELSRGKRVRFAVSDHGRGFDPLRLVPGRFGLTIMRERAEAIGASFSVVSRPGAGTTVEVEL
jgi:signal transduction histidine kinase